MEMSNRIAGDFQTDSVDDMAGVPVVPAPWHLSGRGYLALYKFNREFLKEKAFLDLDEGMTPAGGFGALMIVDYSQSDAGPYSELLFIPGKVHLEGRCWHRITKIYVSTRVSVLNGRKNWAIPKELAVFRFSKKGRVEIIDVEKEGNTFFKAGIHVCGPRFPVSTVLFPFSLLQGTTGSYLQTSFTGSGWARPAKLRVIQSDQKYFPRLDDRRPLAVFAIDPFRIVFPPAVAIGRSRGLFRRLMNL
jgi:hypothetical protein